MHDFHWRNSPYLRLRTIDENGQSVLRVSRSQAERVYVRSSESLSCSFHFSVTLICATLSLFPSSRFPPRCSVFANLLSLSLLFYDRVSFLVSFSLSTFSFSLWCDHAHIHARTLISTSDNHLYDDNNFISFSLLFSSSPERSPRNGSSKETRRRHLSRFTLRELCTERAALVHDMHVCIDDNRARARLYDA